jgi:hypothetical protein
MRETCETCDYAAYNAMAVIAIRAECGEASGKSGGVFALSFRRKLRLRWHTVRAEVCY